MHDTLVPHSTNLDKQFGTLDVGHQGNGVLHGHPPGYVTLRNSRGVAMLTKGQVDHQTDLLLREVVGNVLIGGRAILTNPVVPIGSG